MSHMNAFNSLVSDLAAANLDPDVSASLLDSILNYHSVVRVDLDATKGALDFFKESNEVLMAQNARLLKKVAELEAALKPVTNKVIRFNLGDAFSEACAKEDRYIDFIKWLRNEAIVFEDGEHIGLYEAKYIAEAIFAYYGFKKMGNLPCCGEKCRHIDAVGSSREDVLAFITALLSHNLPDYDLSMLEETLWD